MKERTNNLDVLRLLLAVSVMMWHVYDLSKVEIFLPLAQVFSADLAVKAFFVISGFLVVRSCESSTLQSYVGKRVRRIYPAYLVMILLLACTGVAVSTMSVQEYFGAATLRYVAANLVFLNFLAPTLPGVFEGNAYNEVNGALWTLKIEVLFYAFVPVFVLLRRRIGAVPVLFLLFAASVAYSEAMHQLHDASGRAIWQQLARQLPGQLTYFMAGAACHYFRMSGGACLRLVIAAAGCWLLAKALDFRLARLVLDPIWLGGFTIFIGICVPNVVPSLKIGDLSYGVYIIHFPVIQFLVSAGLFDSRPWVAFLGACISTLGLAALSWRFVERPYLRRDSHYRQISESADSSGRRI